MAKEKTLIEKGDKLRYNGLTSERLTNGAIYEVTGLSDAGSSMYLDNLGSERYLISGIAKHFELVEETVESGGDIVGVSNTELKKGDFVRYVGGDPGESWGDLTVGKVYEIVGGERFGAPFITDDKGGMWFISDFNKNAHCFVKVFGELSEEVEGESIPCDHCGAVLGECAVGGSDGSAYCSNKCADEPVISDYEKKAQDFGEIDAVHQPAHYTQGKFETIEIIEEITQGYSDGFVAHCAGTAIKYIARAPFKHASPLEDLKKSRAYMDFAIARIEGSGE